MEEKEEMRPVIFKGGKDFGKVEGIRGLFKDFRGRWYVRYSCSGIDKQSTIQVNGNPTFSGLERLAQSALKKLKKEVQDEVSHKQPQTPTQESETNTLGSALKKAQKALQKFIVDTYTLSTEEKNVKRRQIQLEGFALITKNTKKDFVDDLNNHNISLMRSMMVELEGQQKSFEYFKGVRAVFIKAIKAGVHVGLNPAYVVSRPTDLTKKDYGFLTIKQMSKIIYSIKNDNNKIVKLSDLERKEIAIFAYLLSLGMRATSAVLFKSSDIEKKDDKYYYTVINHKLKKIMPYKQLLSDFFIKELDILSLEKFTTPLKKMLDVTNEYVKTVNNNGLTVKHFRKGFIGCCVTDGGFAVADVGRLTHIATDTIEKCYYSQAQPKCDEIMQFYNNQSMIEYIFASGE